MFKQIALVPLCGVWLGACAPGPVLRSPPVVGRVIDSQTRAGLPGARVTVAIPGESPSAMPLPDTVSDAQGRFLLEGQYKFGLALVYGDPAVSRVIVCFSKEGYGKTEVRAVCNLHAFSQGALHADAALEPDPIKKNTHL